MQKPIPQKTRNTQSIFQWEDIIITNHQKPLIHHPKFHPIQGPIQKLGYPWMLSDGIVQIDVDQSKPIIIKDLEVVLTCLVNLDKITVFGSKFGIYSVDRNTKKVIATAELEFWITHITATFDGIIVGGNQGQVVLLDFELEQKAVLVERDDKQIQYLEAFGDNVLLAKPCAVTLFQLEKFTLNNTSKWDIPLGIVCGMAMCNDAIRVYTHNCQLYTLTLNRFTDDSLSFDQYNSKCFEEDGEDVDKTQKLFGAVTSFHGLVDTYLIAQIDEEQWGTVMVARHYPFVNGDWQSAVRNTIRNPKWQQKLASFMLDDIIKVYIIDENTITILLGILIEEMNLLQDETVKTRILALMNYACIATMVFVIY
jgi:hypothetical protein